jgi:hypothetical protein
MSWWDTGEGDDVIGDQAADQVREALQQIVDARAKRSQDKPVLADLLWAIAIATGSAGTVLADPPAGVLPLVAQLKSGQTVSSGSPPDERETRDLVGPLAACLRALGTIYQDRWDRKPRLSEWLRALEFVLKYRPEDFLRDGADHRPLRIETR